MIKDDERDLYDTGSDEYNQNIPDYDETASCYKGETPPSSSEHRDALFYPSASYINIRNKDKNGDNKITDIIDAVYDESWSKNIMWLAITAGPLTYVALQAGYLLAYGKLAAFNVFVYFAVFTLIAGVGGIIFRVYENFAARKKQKRAHNSLNVSLEILPDIMKLAQNLRLEQEGNPEWKDIDSSLIILSNAYAKPSELEEAVLCLTHNARLAYAMRRIETYRPYGLSSRVGDIVGEIAVDAAQATEKLRQKSPLAAYWLDLRLMGQAPSAKTGLARSEGFIERLLSWMDTDNADLLRQRDIEEFFTLVYEMLCSREIPMLTIEFRAKSDLNKLSNILSRARNNYRIAQAARFSRLKALGRYLNHLHHDEHLEDMGIHIAAGEADADNLLRKINRGLNAVCDTINADINALRGRRPSREQKLRLRALKNALTHLLDIYRELCEADKRVSRAKSFLEKSLKDWDRAISRNNGDHISFHGIQSRKGLTISESQIRLRDWEKVALANRIAPQLKHFTGRYYDIIFSVSTSLTDDYLENCQDDLKRLLVDVFCALDDYIYLSRADRQRAIDHSRAPNFGAIEMGLSANSKLNLGVALAREVDNDLSQPAEKLLRTMITQYNAEVQQDTLDLLRDRYGARMSVMKVILETETPGSDMPTLTPPQKLTQKPVLQAAWQQVLTRLTVTLKSH